VPRQAAVAPPPPSEPLSRSVSPRFAGLPRVELSREAGSSGGTYSARIVDPAGKPLPDASITFVPADVGEEEPTELGRIVRPSAKTDAEGGYELAWGEQAGAPPGKYNVIIMKFKPTDDDEVKPESLIPEQYTSPKTSGLTRDVKDGDNVFNFDL
jgi:hypothetical protein